VGFATELAEFLAALYRVDPASGPAPGEHNFFRGGPLSTYDAETRDAIATLDGEIDAPAVINAWEAAVASPKNDSPVWFHGDVAASNLLVDDGRLSAVIDFGCSGVGDPACDATIAWTFFLGESRERFREQLQWDDATWARARGWALWKALILLVRGLDGSADETFLKVNGHARQAVHGVVDQVVAEQERRS
jgi:aminoglycoside phosphotransferase (APT) family kinase protein